MRYFSYIEPDQEVQTMSAQEIRETYYPYWYDLMCKKFGKEYVDKTYNFEDCLEDWIIVNWAWEVHDDGT